MKMDTYKSMWEKMKTSEEMDGRIQENVMNYSAQKGKINYIHYAYRIAAAVAVIMIMLQVQPVRAAINNVISHFTNQFEIVWKDKESTVVEMQGDYLEISPKAKKKECKIDSLSQISKQIGINLLESTEAYEIKNCISYYPYVSDSGALNGIMLIDHCYAMGDLKNVKMKTSADISEGSSVSYEKGEKYSSPISVQITIRSNQSNQVDYDNHELEYAGANWNLTEGDGISGINIREVKGLGINAVMFTVESSGPIEWYSEGVEENETFTTAMFIYEGIEYIYNGSVSQDTMEEFLNTLK